MDVKSGRFPVVVTGAASGIGFATVRALCCAGYPVAIVDLNGDQAVAATRQLANEFSTPIAGFQCDITDEVASERTHEEIVSAFGPIGGLVNNAGILPPQKGWIEQLPSGEFDQMMKVHVGGTLNWCRLVIPNMRNEGFGRIVNMSSITAVLAVPHRLAYVTAKRAILGLTEALALDCARAGITVNAIAPGWVLTENLAERAKRGVVSFDALANRIPVGRWAKPEEIARMALFLIDPASSYITGTTMRVDGGLSIRGDADEDLANSPFMAAQLKQEASVKK